VFCGEILFDAVVRTMQVMGVNALDRSHPVEKYLRESVVFPLYDAGNIGMQMRKIFITEDNVDTILAAAAGAE
jgi:nitroalkane oxidase